MFKFPWTNAHELNLDWLVQTVKKLSANVDGAVTSVNGATGDVVLPIPFAYNGTPAALGTAAPGTSTDYARGDHVHPMPPALTIDPTLTIAGAAADAEATGDAIDTVRGAIGETTIETQRIGAYQTGKYWNSQSTVAVLTDVNGYSAFDPIAVEPGDEYTAYIRCGASGRQYPLLFVDGDLRIIEHSTRPSGTMWQTFSGIVPDGAVYALITANTTTAGTLASHSFKTIQHRLTDVPTIRSDLDAISAGAMDLQGKTVAILGDSISTNGNYSESNPWGNVPEIIITSEDVGVTLSAYATLYDVGTVIGDYEIVEADIGTEITFTPATDDVGKYVGVPLTYNPTSRKVWWEVMQEALGFNPIAVCWSGSSVSSHEGSSQTYATSYAWHDAQIRKCGIRVPGTMTRTAPDVIIIYRGTNDFSHGPYDKLTSDYFAAYDWDYPSTDALAGGGYGFKEALSLTIKKLHAAYPSARIILCTLNIFKRINFTHYPTNNGYNSLPQFNDAIREVANFFGIPCIELDKDGITFDNMETDLYITESGHTHPTDKGHRVMGAKALRDFIAKVNSME